MGPIIPTQYKIKESPFKKYKPEFCEMLVEHMENGLTFGCFAALIGTTKQSISLWAKHIPEFSEARQRGAAANELFYMKKAIANLVVTPDGEKLDTNLFRILMRNIHGWDKDEHRVKITTVNKFKDMNKEDQRLEIEKAKAVIAAMEAQTKRLIEARNDEEPKPE